MRIWFVVLALLLAACGSDKATTTGSGVLNFSNATPPAGVVGDTYTFNLTATGGLQPYRYKLDGALPKGLTFGGNRISGVPSEKGSFKIRITLEDANLSTKVSEPTIVIGEPTPPDFQAQLPQSETDQPFIFAARIKGRETGAVRATFQIKDLTPELDTFQVPIGFISISRYDAQKGTLDFDGVFVQPAKDIEIFRLNLRPEVALKPGSTVRQSLAYYDKNRKLFSQTQEVKREKSEGKYSFADLEAIAKNWKKAAKLETPAKEGEKTATPTQEKAVPPTEEKAADPATEKTEEASGEAKPKAPKETTGEEAKTEEAEKEAETTKEQAAEPAKAEAEEAKPKEEAKPAETQETQTKQGEEKPADPAKPETKEGEASKESGAAKEGDTTKPAEPTKPTDAKTQNTTQPAKPEPVKLEGDLNGDAVVNEKDLEVLRGSYRWDSVSNAPSETPADPTKPAAPGNTPKTPTQPGK
jgi:hypothetical protein